jgi:hypothetical protein
MSTLIAEPFLGLRRALRLLRKAPVFAGVATLSPGLGIGANVGVFTLANALLLRALPVDEPERLVSIRPGDDRRADFFTNPLWEEVRDREDPFDGSFAWSPRRVDVSSPGEPTWAPGLLASGGFFEVLGVRPIVGRTFTRADDRRGGGSDGPVAAISHASGAAPRVVCWMVLGDALWVTAIGAAVGSLGAVTSARRASTLVFGLAPTGLATLALALFTLDLAAAAAGFFPAWRASTSSPAMLLRRE